MTDWTNIEPVEVLSLRCKTHTATIRLAPVEGGWTFAASCARMFGDFSGWGEPLGESRGGVLRRFAFTRDDALEAAKAVILERLPDQPIIDWLDSLNPGQADLFGSAA